MNYWVLNKQIYKILFIFISLGVKAQTYIIDNLKVLNEEKVYFNKNVNLKIVHKQDLKFYKVELDSSINVSRDMLYQTYKSTSPSYLSGKVRFICWNTNYELQFFEITDREIIEKFIGFTKIYHIKTIYR